MRAVRRPLLLEMAVVRLSRLADWLPLPNLALAFGFRNVILLHNNSLRHSYNEANIPPAPIADSPADAVNKKPADYRDNRPPRFEN